MLRAIQRHLPALLALSFAAGFVAVASIRLEGQGLHYDELHQAPAAFAWVGKEAPFFNLVQVWGIPLLNMTYSGALKSTLLGWWLRLSGAPFGVVSWRMAGIELTWESLASHLKAYSTLGPGEQALDFVLASAPAPWAATWNTAAMCIALVSSSWRACERGRGWAGWRPPLPCPGLGSAWRSGCFRGGHGSITGSLGPVSVYRAGAGARSWPAALASWS